VKRWWLAFALLLSVGFNLGLLAAMAGGWWATRNATAPPEPVPATVEVVASDDHTAGEFGVPLADEVRVEPPASEAEAEPPPPELSGEEPVRVAQAEGEPPPPPREDGPSGEREGMEREGLERPGPPLDRLADHLGLEGETRRRFLELQRRLFEVQIESRLRRGRLGREMRRELLAAEPDRGRIESLIEQMGATYVEAEKATAETILESRRLLTPQQQRQYLHVLERLRGGGPGGPGGEGRRPGPGQRRRPPPR